jgi:hypothetical protein
MDCDEAVDTLSDPSQPLVRDGGPRLSDLVGRSVVSSPERRADNTALPRPHQAARDRAEPLDKVRTRLEAENEARSLATAAPDLVKRRVPNAAFEKGGVTYAQVESGSGAWEWYVPKRTSAGTRHRRNDAVPEGAMVRFWADGKRGDAALAIYGHATGLHRDGQVEVTCVDGQQWLSLKRLEVLRGSEPSARLPPLLKAAADGMMAEPDSTVRVKMLDAVSVVEEHYIRELAQRACDEAAASSTPVNPGEAFVVLGSAWADEANAAEALLEANYRQVRSGQSVCTFLLRWHVMSPFVRYAASTACVPAVRRPVSRISQQEFGAH